MDKFWMVYSPQGGQRALADRYATAREACTEAIRLARANNGHEYVVLEGRYRYRTEEAPVKCEMLERPLADQIGWAGALRAVGQVETPAATYEPSLAAKGLAGLAGRLSDDVPF